MTEPLSALNPVDEDDLEGLVRQLMEDGYSRERAEAMVPAILNGGESIEEMPDGGRIVRIV
ncbi:MAG: hypothetical protein K6T35_01695 [Meiothermus silvanus]|nr:hypothetical protein [Allomeiothermus silvanus]